MFDAPFFFISKLKNIQRGGHVGDRKKKLVLTLKRVPGVTIVVVGAGGASSEGCRGQR